MSWKTYTAGVLIAAAVVLIIWDVIVAIRGGNTATISQVLYHAAQAEPVIALALGIVLGHLFWPQAK